MVVVYVRTVDPASIAGLPKPVQLAIRGDAIDQRKARQRSAIHRKDERQTAGLRAPQQSLPGEEAQQAVGEVQERQRFRVVRVRAPEDELRKDEQAEYSHGKKNGIPSDLHLAFKNLLADPEQKQGRRAGLHQEDRPGFGRAEGERSKQEQTEDAVEQNRAGLFRVSASRVRGGAVCAHEIESMQFEGLLPFRHETEIVDPELTTDRTAFRHAPDAQYQQSAVVSRW